MDHSEPALPALLSKGVNRADSTGDPIPDLGFRAAFWNHREHEDSAGVSTHCGAWWRDTTNNFLLDLPEPQAAPELYDPAAARAIIQTIVASWDPAWATWTSRELEDLQDDHVTGQSSAGHRSNRATWCRPGSRNRFGWATYFSTLLEPPKELPPGADLQGLDTGWLLTIGDDPADVPADLLLAVRDLLDEEALA